MAAAADDKDRWGKWYWGHWRADAALRSCSIGARGLWMEMLTIMAEAAPIGHLLINGQKPSPEQLARACAVSLAELRRFTAELIAAGVPSVDDGGVLINRRMVRDARRREINRANGGSGGNPTLTGRRPIRKTEPDNQRSLTMDKASIKASDNRIGYPNGISGTDNQLDKSHATRAKRGEEGGESGEEQNPSSAPQLTGDSPPPPAADAAPVDWFDVLLEACRLSGIDQGRAANMHAVCVDWARAGWSPTADIYPTITEVASRAGYEPPRSVAYFGHMIAQRHALRIAPPPVTAQVVQHPAAAGRTAASPDDGWAEASRLADQLGGGRRNGK